MCVLLVCPKGVRPSLEILRACARENPHGGGIAWRRVAAVEWMKSDDVDEIFRVVNKAKGEIVIHFRVASAGGVCKELRHPFPITPKVRLDECGRSAAVLFQNGHWGGYRDALEHAEREGHRVPEGRMSDTRAAAFLCSIYGRSLLQKLTPSRWVYFTANETATFGHWRERNGIVFSNLNWEWQLNLDRHRASFSPFLVA
jgi:hypothetical protein